MSATDDVPARRTQGPGRRLRELIAAPEQLVMPSGWDCLTARLLEVAGFDALHLSGAALSASRLGKPDFGFLGLSDLTDTAQRMSAAVDVPVLADADTGFGGTLSAVRTVHELCAAGAAGMHIEDQSFPKRCGHLAGKSVVALDEYLTKLRAVVSERPDPEFIIVARTDVLAVEGVDAAIDRAQRSLDAGADAVFVEAPATLDDLERIGREIDGPNLYNMATGGVGPRVSLRDLAELGFGWVLMPTLAMGGLYAAVRDLSRAIITEGNDDAVHATGFGPTVLAELFGGPQLRALEDSYARDGDRAG